jgi:hypothetical protein
MENKFRCNTTPIHFVDALTRIIEISGKQENREHSPLWEQEWRKVFDRYWHLEIMPEVHETPDGSLLLVFTAHSTEDPDPYHVVFANGTYYYGETGRRGVGIQFDIQPISDARILVLSMCLNSLFLKEYDALLEIVCDLYPEARAGIQPQLSERSQSPGEAKQTYTETSGNNTRQSTKSRANKDRQRVEASLIRWATEIKHFTSQGKACEIVGMNQRTYQRYRDSQLCYTDADIEGMGSTFEELWNLLQAGRTIDDILEFD